MLSLVFLLIIALIILFLYPAYQKRREKLEAELQANKKLKQQLLAALSAATLAIKERKYQKAEKLLLTALKYDEKNITAYNRLGILYAKQGKYSEAIKSFEIASGLDDNPISLHNTGLIYFEMKDFERALMSFQQAARLDPSSPTHQISIARAEMELGNRLKAIEAYEEAYTLTPNVAILKQILKIHLGANNEEGVIATKNRILAAMPKKSTKAKKAR